ncbi:DUF2125 domain-containing protein [Amorphus sp. 3PC139-8]|uniref:DUF2125 domain-containing protein n=1 Tax=Amorphus sp. 3PC139-8 TaxID=2735676 RepID=UPI00345CCCD8
MATDEQTVQRKPSRMRRRMLIMLAVVLVIAVAWSVFWFVAAAYSERLYLQIVDQGIEQDVAFDCVDRRIEGYPFRIELRCGEGTSLTTPDATIELGGLTAVALIYDPWHAITELSAPAVVSEGPFDPTTITWSLAHASVAISDGALERLSISIEQPRAEPSELPPLVADLAEIHLRSDPNSNEAVNVAVRLDGLEPIAAAPKADLMLVATVDGARSLMSGDTASAVRRLLTSEGVPIKLTRVSVKAGQAAVSAAGNLVVRPNGMLDGQLNVAVSGDGASLPYLDELAPSQADTLRNIVTTVLSFGQATQIDGEAARAFPLKISSGRVSAGIIPLGKLPPLPIGLLAVGG